MATIKEDIATLKAEMKAQSQLSRDLKNSVDGLHEKLDSRFAGKWVERVIQGVLVLGLGGLFTAMLTTVTKAISFFHGNGSGE